MAKLTRTQSAANAGKGSLVYTLTKLVNDLAAKVNVAFGDGLLADGTLAISATAEKFKTTTTAYYRINGVQYTKAATDSLVFSAADTINTAGTAGTFWGVWLVQINAAATISTKSPSADQVYDSEAEAIADLPDPDTSNVALGYITVNSASGTKWTANTDDLTDASDVTEANFYDATVLTYPGTDVDTITFRESGDPS